WAQQIEVQILAVQAWIAQANGNRSQALKLMRGAADLEDSTEKHVAMENRLYPMRELLADLQREQGDPGAALTEYELAMKAAPNRLRSFYGAAKAAEAIGQKKMALTYWKLLAKLTQDADSERPELAELKQVLISKAQ